MRFHSFWIFITTLFLATSAWGGPSEYLRSLTSQALGQGFPRQSLAVLRREEGPGREAASRALRVKLDGRLGRRLIGTGLAANEDAENGESLFLRSDKGYLDVLADGTKFIFRGDIDNPEEIAKSRGKGRVSDVDLESLGRAFIQSLPDLIPIAPNEKLTFLGTRFLKNASIPIKQEAVATDLSVTAPRPSWLRRSPVRRGESAMVPVPGPMSIEVVASIAYFGREIDGTPVVGKGSRIAVWFDNGREPVALEADWPRYSPTGLRQEILPWDELRRRAESLDISLNGGEGVAIKAFDAAIRISARISGET